MNEFNSGAKENPSLDDEYENSLFKTVYGFDRYQECSDDPIYRQHVKESNELDAISRTEYKEKLWEVNHRKEQKAEHARQLKRQEDSLRAHYASSIYTRNI